MKLEVEIFEAEILALLVKISKRRFHSSYIAYGMLEDCKVLAQLLDKRKS